MPLLNVECVLEAYLHTSRKLADWPRRKKVIGYMHPVM